MNKIFLSLFERKMCSHFVDLFDTQLILFDRSDGTGWSEGRKCFDLLWIALLAFIISCSSWESWAKTENFYTLHKRIIERKLWFFFLCRRRRRCWNEWMWVRKKLGRLINITQSERIVVAKKDSYSQKLSIHLFISLKHWDRENCLYHSRGQLREKISRFLKLYVNNFHKRHSIPL